MTALAGCSANQPNDVPIIPTSRTAEPVELTLAPRDVTVTYRLQGSTLASSYVGFTVPENTTLTVAVKPGQAVHPGTAIGNYQPDEAVLAELRSAARSGTIARSQLRSLRSRSGTLVSPVSGTNTALAGQPRIAANGLDAVVMLTPLQVLRYRSLDFVGSVSVETEFRLRSTPCPGPNRTLPAQPHICAGRPSRFDCRSAAS